MQTKYKTKKTTLNEYRMGDRTMPDARILVVEDEKIVSMEIQDRLERLGYSVLAVVSRGEEAIKKAEELQPDLVLMDIVLRGDMDGVETARQIRSRFDIPVIYLTAFSSDDILQRAKITEPFGYIIKPFDERELYTAIEMALYKHEMEKKLKENEQWLATTLKSIGDAVITTDTNGLITFMNPIAEKMTGWKQEDSIGKPVKNIFKTVNEKTGKQLEDPAIKVIGEGVVIEQSENTLLITRSGIKIPIDNNSAPIKDEKGKVSGAVLTFRDITERKRAEARMTKLNQCFLNLGLDHSKNIAKLVNTAGEILGGACMLYNRFDKERKLLCTWAVWQEPEGYNPEDNPEGHICYDVIKANTEKPIIIEDFTGTKYEKTDPNVKKYKLKSYIGQPVELNGEVVGSFCLCDLKKRKFMKDEIELISMLGKAVSIEEQRKHAEEALRESEERYRALYDDNPSMYFTVDPEGTVLSVNKFGSEQLGYSAEELINQPVLNIFHPDDRNAVLEQFDLCLKNSNRIGRWEFRKICKDGSTMWVGEAARAIQDANGNTVVLVVCENITEQKQAEEALAAEKELLAVTLRSIGDGVITTDTSGNIVLVNKVAEKITGWSQKNAVNKPLDDVFHIINEKTRERCDNPVKKVLETGEIVNLCNNTVLIANDGTEKIIADSGAPIYDKDSKIIGVVLVFRDVSEERKIEEELQKAQRLESIGFLAGGIAHDFNNILTAIMGNISLAKSDLSPEGEIFEILTEAEKASIQAKNLTHQLLTFSKGGAPVKKTTSIAKIVNSSVDFTLSGSNVRCDFLCPHDLFSVEVDEGQISQVIQNLIINAKQAMPRGGAIRVEIENVFVKDKAALPLQQGKYVKISCSDKGIGISAQYLPKIFDPYFTTKQKGSGLGLAIAYSIIKRHDGCIKVESELDHGTTFIIYLPASDEPILENEEVIHEYKSMKGKILVMDDEEFIRNIASRMLPRFGYEVMVSKDGNEALQLYADAKKSSQPFDVVILDLTVPGGMGGMDTIMKLIEIDPNVKAIVSSGYSNDPIMADFKAFGFRGAIGKPYKGEEMREALQAVLCS